MAGRGFPPSGNRARERDNRETTKVTRGTRLHGPALPKAEDVFPKMVDPETGAILEIDLQRDWHPMTKKWWDGMRRSPLTVDCGPEDWSFLLDTAFLHHLAWTDGQPKLFAEVRLRAAKFGVTPEDRARLGIEITKPAPPTGQRKAKAKAAPSNVSSIEDRRARLTGTDG